MIVFMAQSFTWLPDFTVFTLLLGLLCYQLLIIGLLRTTFLVAVISVLKLPLGIDILLMLFDCFFIYLFIAEDPNIMLI